MEKDRESLLYKLRALKLTPGESVIMDNIIDCKLPTQELVKMEWVAYSFAI